MKGQQPVITYTAALKRSQRYAAVLERMISPEATYPVLGRSLAYRFGAFQLLSQIALQHDLPEHVSPQQVRAAFVYHDQEAVESKRNIR